MGPTLSTRPSARGACHWEPAEPLCPVRRPFMVCPPQRQKAGNKTHAHSENNQRRPPTCNPAGFSRHTERTPRGLFVPDVFWSSPHSPGGWCAPPLGILGNLRAQRVEHHSENSAAGRDCPGPRRFRIVACEFLRAGWDSCDRLTKTDRKGGGTPCTEFDRQKDPPPHTA